MPKKQTLKKKKNLTKKNNKCNNCKLSFSQYEYHSGDGMLTSVWGPPFWFILHTMSFNYPVEPTSLDKKNYKKFVINLQHILPCKYCRINLKNNFKHHPLNNNHLKNRDSFSRYIYQLHNTVNTMLNKPNNITYEQVRDRYEHFRSRCTVDKPQLFNFTKKKKEKGCTKPLYKGSKPKCQLKIVENSKIGDTLTIDKKCFKTKL